MLDVEQTTRLHDIPFDHLNKSQARGIEVQSVLNVTTDPGDAGHAIFPSERIC